MLWYSRLCLCVRSHRGGGLTASQVALSLSLAASDVPRDSQLFSYPFSSWSLTVCLCKVPSSPTSTLAHLGQQASFNSSSNDRFLSLHSLFLQIKTTLICSQRIIYLRQFHIVQDRPELLMFKLRLTLNFRSFISHLLHVGIAGSAIMSSYVGLGIKSRTLCVLGEYLFN